MSVSRPPSPARRRFPNPAICASAAFRLLWCAGALLALWTCVLWALR